MKPAKQTDSKRILAAASAEPDLSALATDLATSLALAATVRRRQDVASRVRYNEWEGQSDDFRKHAADLGKEAMPFEGAADTRPMIVDAICNERVALQLEALMAGEMQAMPMGSEDVENATRMTRVLHYMRDVLLLPELRREAELLANYQEADDPGIGILKIWWKRETALELRTLSLEDVGRELLRLRGLQMPEDGAEPAPAVIGAVDDITDLMFNPLRKDEAVQTLALAFPTVAGKNLRRALRELQRTGETDLPLPFVKENRPSVTALRYMTDIFFPADLDDIQRGRGMHEYVRLSEAELRERALSEGFGEDWIADVLAAGPGPSESWIYGHNARVTQWVAGEREVDSLYEIVYSHVKAADDYGITGVYLTVWSARVKKSYGKHELLNCPDGEYPYVIFRAENTGRGVFMSRGVAAIAGAAQHEIKVQRDCRTDYTMLSTIPPVKVRQRRGGLEMVLGPMVEVPVKDQEDVQWMTPPPFPQMSIEVEKATRADLNEYFGRLVPDVPPELRHALLQKKVNTWTDTWVQVWKKVVQLMQDNMDPLDLSLVADGPMQTLTRDEIRGRFHLLLKFSVNDLNMEFVMKRLDAVAKVLQFDIAGNVDHTAILRFGLRGIDPTLAQLGLRDDSSATAAEQKDELNAVMMMSQGIQPPLRENGINAQLRMQTLQQAINNSPVLARRLMQPAGPDDEFFHQLVEERQKNLTFQIQQITTNAQAGRTGVKSIVPEIADGS